ncbi:hypothetical protein LB519_24785 [Mesorhizobium sp. AD1-1]|uniref:hypothetical protein n=1 Tax=Mesorhizobium sp. AD1-1 TaxID=2876621 RepID=UPI001CCBD834|nr:hypothetical protein [Mesorhizobium sp. AD1-1]MBZ9721065.1 hypothetical protein [Mesorhizobium sp. AD1-1]
MPIVGTLRWHLVGRVCPDNRLQIVGEVRRMDGQCFGRFVALLSHRWKDFSDLDQDFLDQMSHLRARSAAHCYGDQTC